MCLLVVQSKNSPKLSNEWLEDFYSYNADGVGVMYAKRGKLVIEKVVPKSAECFIKFYRKHIEGRNCAFHLRMKTHGHINLENTHPYEVLNQREHGLDLWLMHNGVLSTGNAKDVSKSDTWHYIRDYLRPMLAQNPDYAFTQSFAELVGSHIGKSNKFVLADNRGRTITINKDEGVYWGGLWLSNTYAWSASKSASKAESHDLAEALKQVSEKPDAKSYNSYLGVSDWYEGDMYGSNALEYEIEGIVAEFQAEGLELAGSLTHKEAKSFVDKYGIDSFYDIAYMCIDKNITEDWFIRAMTNHKEAEQAFPWLSTEKAYIARGQYAY